MKNPPTPSTPTVQADALPGAVADAVFYLPTARDRRYAEPAAARRSFRADRAA